MNDFVMQLTATLQLPVLQEFNVDQMRDNERTMSSALHATTHLRQRCQELRQ